MAEKKNPPADAAADRNVEQIRDILFGGQMRDYERRFLEITQRLEQESQRLRADLDKRLTALEKRVDEQNDKLAKQLVEADYEGWVLMEAATKVEDKVAALGEQKALWEQMMKKARQA